MQSIFHRWVAVAALTIAGAVQAAPVTFVDQGASYQYKTMNLDLWSNWSAVNLATFDTFAAANSPISGWSTGNAAFGNPYSLPYATEWAADTDLALYKTFEITGGSPTGTMTLNVASDNGFVIYLNDQLLAKENAEGYTSYWEYTFTQASSFLVSGTNVLKIMAEDHGGATFFDMKLTGHVPEPGSLALVGLALLGVGAARRRAVR